MLNVQMKPIPLNARLWIYSIKDIFLKDSIDTESPMSVAISFIFKAAQS